MYPYDAITIYGEYVNATGTAAHTIITNPAGSGQDWTILDAHYYINLRTSNIRIELDCGSDPILVQDSSGASATMPIEKSDQIQGNIMCDNRLYISSNSSASWTLNYVVTYVPYNINSSTTSPSYLLYSRDSFFALAIIIVLLFLMFMGFVKNSLFKRKTW